MQRLLLKKQLDTNTILLELIELRFRKSLVSALDVFQQQQVVERTKSEIPLVEKTEQLLHHEIAMLLGKHPKTTLRINQTTLPVLTKVPANGIPADLLANRPDIRASSARLQSADWQVASAKANRLPTIRLTAGMAYSAGNIDFLLENWLLNLAANLTAPIFDGGSRAAEVERTRGVVDEMLANHQHTVLSAIKEVEDALVSENKQHKHLGALKKQLTAARNGFTEARSRYLSGLNDYLPVLTQLLTVQNLERELIKQETELIITRVNLYRALGGTWTHILHGGELKMSDLESKTHG
jgi:outer membrane protein TolC